MTARIIPFPKRLTAVAMGAPADLARIADLMGAYDALPKTPATARQRAAILEALKAAGAVVNPPE